MTLCPFFPLIWPLTSKYCRCKQKAVFRVGYRRVALRRPQWSVWRPNDYRVPRCRDIPNVCDHIDIRKGRGEEDDVDIDKDRNRLISPTKRREHVPPFLRNLQPSSTSKISKCLCWKRAWRSRDVRRSAFRRCWSFFPFVGIVHLRRTVGAIKKENIHCERTGKKFTLTFYREKRIAFKVSAFVSMTSPLVA